MGKIRKVLITRIASLLLVTLFVFIESAYSSEMPHLRIPMKINENRAEKAKVRTLLETVKKEEGDISTHLDRLVEIGSDEVIIGLVDLSYWKPEPQSHMIRDTLKKIGPERVKSFVLQKIYSLHPWSMGVEKLISLLGYLGAIDSLRELMEHWQESETMIGNIIKYGIRVVESPESVSALVKWLDNPNEQNKALKRELILALGRIGSDEAISALLNRFDLNNYDFIEALTGASDRSQLAVDTLLKWRREIYRKGRNLKGYYLLDRAYNRLKTPALDPDRTLLSPHIQLTEVNKDFLHKGEARKWDEETSLAMSDALAFALGVRLRNRQIEKHKISYKHNPEFFPEESGKAKEDEYFTVEKWSTQNHINFIRVGYLFFIDQPKYNKINDEDLLMRLGPNLIILPDLGFGRGESGIKEPIFGSATITSIVCMMHLDFSGVRFIEAGAGREVPLCLAAVKMGVPLGTKSLVAVENFDPYKKDERKAFEINGLEENKDFIMLDDLREFEQIVQALPNDGQPIIIGSNIGYWEDSYDNKYNRTNNGTSIGLITYIEKSRPSSQVVGFISGGLALNSYHETEDGEEIHRASEILFEKKLLKALGFQWDGSMAKTQVNHRLYDQILAWAAFKEKEHLGDLNSHLNVGQKGAFNYTETCL